MRSESYTEYLEVLVLSLMAERKNPNADIVSVDREHPSTTDVTFAPHNVQHEISVQRENRKRSLTADQLAKVEHTKRLYSCCYLQRLETSEQSLYLNGSHYSPLYNPDTGNKNPIVLVRNDYVNSVSLALDALAVDNTL